MIVTMRMPAGQTSVQYGALSIHANPDGTFGVPKYAVPELVAAGCAIVTEGVGDVNVRAELEAATAAELMSIYLPSVGIEAGYAEAHARALAAFDATAKPQTLTSTQFLSRFTDAERSSVFTAAMGSPQMLQFVVTAAAATRIDLTDPAVQGGVNSLVGTILTADRAAAILDH